MDGTVFKILEFQHVKPGKGGAFVRTKLRRAADGNVIDRTFRAGEKFRSVRTESRKMQFLYADGNDAHFMDTESFEQIAVAESAVEDALRWCKPSSEVEVLFIDDQPAEVQLPSAVDLEVTQTDSGACGGTRCPAAAPSLRRSRPARSFRSRCSSSRASGSAWTRARATTSREPRMRRSEQRRAAVIALYQHDLTGRPLEQVFGANDSPFARALARAAADRAQELDEVIDRHAHGWSVERIQPLERSIMRVALVEMLHPGAVPAEEPIPAEGAIEEAVECAKSFCGVGRSGVRQRRAGRSVARGARECSDPMSGNEHLDDLIARMERAAEQLRSGECSPDAAATLVEDCATLAGPGRGGARAARAGRGRRRRRPDRTLCSRAPRAGERELPGAPARGGRAPPGGDALLLRRHLTAGLEEAMRYSLLAGGKRIRPVLVLATARAIGLDRSEVMPLAGRDRADPHLLADPRRPAGDGRR